MKPIALHAAGAIALTFTIAACVPAPSSTPVPTPTPTPVATAQPAPAPAPTPQPTYGNWLDAPRTPGTWRFSGDQAAYVERDGDGARAPSAPLFIMECKAGSLDLIVQVASDRARSMTIRTETEDRTLALEPASSATAKPIYHRARLQPRDPLLDAMALTRGRFAVETSGSPALYLPAWAEVTRVIEDCR